MKLDDYQKLVNKLALQRGYDQETVEDKMLLMIEEVGELAKAIRQQSARIKNGDHSQSHDIESELADVFWILLTLANKLDINLATAFLEKERINQARLDDKK